MRLNLKKLKQLSVETESGVILGRVFDVVFEIDAQSIVQYIVKQSVISSKEYVINVSQIVRFEQNKIIVKDNIKLADDHIESEGVQIDAEPVAMRKS